MMMKLNLLTNRRRMVYNSKMKFHQDFLIDAWSAGQDRMQCGSKGIIILSEFGSYNIFFVTFWGFKQHLKIWERLVKPLL